MKPYCTDDELLTAVNAVKTEKSDVAEETMAVLLGSVAIDLRRLANAAEKADVRASLERR